MSFRVEQRYVAETVRDRLDRFRGPAVRAKTCAIRYLAAVEDALASGQPVSDRAIASALKMSRQTLYEWRQERRFCRWMAEQLRGRNEHDWQLVLRRHTALAIRGSVKSAEFLLKVLALAGGRQRDEPDADVDLATNYRVDVLVKQTPQGLVSLLIPRPPPLGEEPE